MKISNLFTKARKESPKDEVSANARLLEQAGYVFKNMAGVYSYLPLGHMVLGNIMNIIRDEMNEIEGQEVLLSTLQNPEIWEKTGRWGDDVIDIWFRTELNNGSALGLANTHEEPMAEMMTHYVDSYKDLPRYIYQFQTKFRNEPRAKSGIMRTREFIMKDLYSFSKNQEELDDFYEKCKQAYLKIFEKLGLGEVTYTTFASGGAFSKYSHEFQTISEAGEDTIYVDEDKKIAVNKEVLTEEVIKELKLSKDKLIEKKSIEVGNIFKLGTKYSEALELNYVDSNGDKHPVVMGSYGIGPGRVMGAIVEVCHDDKGIIWPRSIAPFDAYLISLDGRDEEADKIKSELESLGLKILFDDREDASTGEKFANADLLGMPLRLVVSNKTIGSSSVEVKKRGEDEVSLVNLSELKKIVDF